MKLSFVIILYCFQENLALIEKLKLQEDALQHLHDQLIQATTNAGDSRENYEK